MRSSQIAILTTIVSITLVTTPKLGMGQWASDQWLEEPVDAAAFESWQPFFAYDHQLAFELDVREAVEDDGIRIESLAFTSTPDTRVYADHYTVPMTSGPRPYVVLLHGGIESGKRSARRMAEFLVRRGFGVMAIDLPYFGERDTGLLGTFSESDKHEALYNRESRYLQWVIQVVKDVGRTVDFLMVHHDVDPERLGLVGYSRGAQVGFVVLAVEKRLQAGAMLYGGHFDRSESGHLAAACPANYIGRIAPRPLWLLNGTFDGDYDREKSVEPLMRHAGEPTEIHWVPTGHQLPREEDLEKMAEWLYPLLRP